MTTTKMYLTEAEAKHFTTKISEKALRISVIAMGGNPNESDHRIVAAMVMDEQFREKVTRFMFDRALQMVNGDHLKSEGL